MSCVFSDFPEGVLHLVGKELVDESRSDLTNRIRTVANVAHTCRLMLEWAEIQLWPELIGQAPEPKWELERNPAVLKNYVRTMMAGGLLGRPAKRRKLSALDAWKIFVEEDIEMEELVLKEFVRVNLNFTNSYDFSVKYLTSILEKSRRSLGNMDKFFPLKLYSMQKRNAERL